mmetsp:Transcript_29824/g.26372  ORF Transcript_29824/g.26372 Transcript_29824/m.26372 type:complete len:287 (+) Transcript_29824:76-936(+)
MGSCCGGDASTNDENKTEQSIASSKTQSTTQSIGLSDKGDKNNNKEKHSRRNTSTKGMTRLTMKFPHIRYSFKECKKVFNSHCINQNNNNDGSGYITKAQVRPLLVELGATSSQLTDEEIDRIVTTSNLDGDDKIDFKEFLIAAAIGCFLNDSINQEIQSNEFKKIRKGFLVAREAFDYIDDDKSGEIDFEELKKAFSAMKHDDLIMERLKELDFNGDKSIEFPEFVWGITAWVGMDPDGDDDIDEDDFDDANTEMNTGDVKSPKHRLSVDDATNPNNPTFEDDEQ